MRQFFKHQKPVAVVCHGAEIVSTAIVIAGNCMATMPKCNFDIEDGRAKFVDEGCVRSGIKVSGRGRFGQHSYLAEIMPMLKAFADRPRLEPDAVGVWHGALAGLLRFAVTVDVPPSSRTHLTRPLVPPQRLPRWPHLPLRRPVPRSQLHALRRHESPGPQTGYGFQPMPQPIDTRRVQTRALPQLCRCARPSRQQGHLRTPRIV